MGQAGGSPVNFGCFEIVAWSLNSFEQTLRNGKTQPHAKEKQVETIRDANSKLSPHTKKCFVLPKFN